MIRKIDNTLNRNTSTVSQRGALGLRLVGALFLTSMLLLPSTGLAFGDRHDDRWSGWDGWGKSHSSNHDAWKADWKLKSDHLRAWIEKIRNRYEHDHGDKPPHVDPDPPTMPMDGAVWITFDEEDIGLGKGDVVDTQYEGVTISGDDARGDVDLATIFTLPTHRIGGVHAYKSHRGKSKHHWKKRRPHHGGKGSVLTPLSPKVARDLGNILVVQGNDRGCEDGTCNKPRPTRGSIHFAFSEAVSSFGFDLIFNKKTLKSDGPGTVTFSDEGGNEVELSLIDVLFGLEHDSISRTMSDDDDDDDGWGHDKWKRHPGKGRGLWVLGHVEPITASMLGLDSITDVSFDFFHKAGLDNIHYKVVPEPGTALLLGLALAGLAATKRRRAIA